MLPRSYRAFRQNRPLFFYCVLCGALYFLAILGWALLWRLQFIREALAQMEQIHDEMARNEAYHRLGGFFFLFSLAFAGIFAFAFVVLDLRILGPRPAAMSSSIRKARPSWGAAR
ncbi:hypothetical protein SDC9_87050 [bioreactor metagenome]|uniref:Uncharacterized protein n=1 Tax=bioreactor metagenome TaxID=1076179 RepID=A0A644ZHV9_9ZZZZ